MFAFILLLLPIIQAQTSLSFGQTTTASCVGPLDTSLFPHFNYTLSVPVEQWPANSPATQFLIEFRGTQYDDTIWASFSSDMSNPWTVLADSRFLPYSELWIPYNSEMTTVYITVTCSATDDTYSLRPIIPNLVNGTTSIAGLNMISVSAGEPMWWVLPPSFNLEYVWAELCEGVAYPTMRVVHPGVNITERSPCQISNSYAYAAYSQFNYVLSRDGIVGIQHISFNKEVYFSIYAFNSSYNLYVSTGANTTIDDYTAPLAGYISTTGVVMGSDLVIVGNNYFPNTNLDLLKFYYLDISANTNINSMSMQSACYLKKQAQTILFNGSLTHDNQITSLNAGVKAKNIFHGGTPVDGTLAIIYNDTVVISIIYIGESVKFDMTHDKVMLGVVIGLSVFSALVLIAFIILFVKYRKHKYQPIQ